MADFRKWFMVIAVVLLAAAAANAQTQIANIPCFTSAQVPVIRNGGQTEYIGEVDLNCDATQVKTVPSILVQFTFSVDTTVTNSTVSNSIDNLGFLTMAGLAVQDTVAPQAVLSAYQGRVGNNYQNSNNTLRFPHVVLPMGTTFTVRIFNVRVAALALSSAFAGTQLFGIVAANTENPIGYNVGITNQPAEGILVAVVQDTYSFAVTDCKGAVATAALQFQQCQDYLLEGTTGVGTQGIGGASGVQVFGVKFTELQQTAFKNIVQEDGATVPQDGPAPNGVQICDTGHEAIGYEAVIDDTAGPLGVPTPCTSNAWVSNGTRLLAQFQVNPNLVGKLHIYVSQFQTASSTGATAKLATTTSANGWGLDTYKTSTAVSCSNNSVGGASPNNWVLLPDGATETASWEIINDNLGAFDNLTFAWTIVYSENQLPPTPVGSTSSAAVLLTGNIAPIATLAPAPVGLGVEPVVRFALPFQNGAVSVTITDCVTNLLFPYVTNIAGFNTGIAISNTSLDTAWNLNPVPAVVDSTFGTALKPQPFNTVPQQGPCDLYLFGSSIPQNMAGAGTSVQAIASGATPIVAAGQTFADTLTNIFNLNKAPTVITGYVIARCSFQFGHGYAYLVDPTGRPQGYLALIIPDRSVLNGFGGFGPFFESTPIRVAVPFSNSILDEQGEILAP